MLFFTIKQYDPRRKRQYLKKKHYELTKHKKQRIVGGQNVDLSIYCVIFVTAYKATVTHFVTATAAATIRIIVTIATFRYASNHSLRILLCTRTSLNVSPKVRGTKPRSTVITTSEGIVVTPRAFHVSRRRTMCS